MPLRHVIGDLALDVIAELTIEDRFAVDDATRSGTISCAPLRRS